MKVYYRTNDVVLAEAIARFGFTNDLPVDAAFNEFDGVQVSERAEGDAAFVAVDVPEAELVEHEILAEGWEQDGYRHAGFGVREFLVPARVLNRYDRHLC